MDQLDEKLGTIDAEKIVEAWTARHGVGDEEQRQRAEGLMSADPDSSRQFSAIAYCCQLLVNCRPLARITSDAVIFTVTASC